MTEQSGQKYRFTSITLTSFLLLCLVAVPLVFADVNNGWALEPNGGGTSIFYELEKNLEDSQLFANVYNITTAGNEFNIPVFCDSDGDGKTEMITYENDIISIHGLDGGNNLVLEQQMQINFTEMVTATPDDPNINSVACVDIRGDTINQDIILLHVGQNVGTSIFAGLMHTDFNTNIEGGVGKVVVDNSDYELYFVDRTTINLKSKITCQQMKTINGFPLKATQDEEYECAFTGNDNNNTFYLETVNEQSDIDSASNKVIMAHFNFERWQIPTLSDSYQQMFAIGQRTGGERILYGLGKQTDRLLGYSIGSSNFTTDITIFPYETEDYDATGLQYAGGIEYGNVQMVDLFGDGQLYPCMFGMNLDGGVHQNVLFWNDQGVAVSECFSQNLGLRYNRVVKDDITNRQEMFSAVSWHNWDTFLPNYRDAELWNFRQGGVDYGTYAIGTNAPPNFVPPSVGSDGGFTHLTGNGFSAAGQSLLKTALTQTEDIQFTIVYAVGNSLVTFNLNETLPQYYSYNHSKYSSNMFVDFNNDFGVEWVSYDQITGDIIVYTDLVTTAPPPEPNIQLQNTSRVGDGYYGFYEGVNCNSSTITFYALEGTGQEYTYNSTVPTSQERICTTCGDTVPEFCGAYSFNSPQVSCNLATGNYSINLYIESDEAPLLQQGVLTPALPLEVASGTFGLDCNILDELIQDPITAPPDVDDDQLGDNTTDPEVGEPPTNGEEPQVQSVDDLIALVFGNASGLFKFIASAFIIIGMGIFTFNRSQGNNVLTLIGGGLGAGICLVAGLISIGTVILGVILLVIVAFVLHKFQHPTLQQ